MKKILLIVLLFINFGVDAQGGPDPFAEPQNDNTFHETNVDKNNLAQSPMIVAGDPGGGNPGDPVPIDDYIPILFLTAVGIIVYRAATKQKLPS